MAMGQWCSYFSFEVIFGGKINSTALALADRQASEANYLCNYCLQFNLYGSLLFFVMDIIINEVFHFGNYQCFVDLPVSA